MSFARRTILSLAALFALAAGLVCLALATVIEEGERALLSARIDHALERIVNRAERVVGLGVSLEALRQISAALEAVVADNERVLAAEVFDLQGLSVVSSDRGIRGEPVPDAWLQAARRAGADGALSARYRGADVAGRTIRTDFGALAGYAVVIVDRPEAGDRLLPGPLGRLALVGREAAVALPFAAAAGLLAAVGVLAAVRRRVRPLAAALDGAADAPADPTARAIARARRALEGARADVSAARARLDAIDRDI